MNRLFLFLVSIVVIAAASCGGGGGAQTPVATNNGSPAATTPAPQDTSSTLAAELARLDTMTAPAGVEPDTWLTLKASLREAMVALMPDKVTQAPPDSEHSAITDLAYSVDDDQIGWFTWSFQHYADYNLDGIVDTDDIVTLAEHYLELVGEEAPIAARLDTSGNGVVDIADVTAIARHYGSELAGFSVRSYTDEMEFNELGPVAREEAINQETPEFPIDGVLRYQFQYEGTEEWVDIAVAALDGEGVAGELSNIVQFQPPRIISVSVPSGKVGDTGTASAMVEGAEPLTYEWILTNGLSPTRSSEPEVAVELVRQGMFNGRLTVSNTFGSATQNFAVSVGVPPTISTAGPDFAVCGQRVEFSATASGTAPLAYSWDFGTSAFPQTSALARPTVEFDAAGTHNVNLQVSNAHGSALHTFTVTAGFPPTIIAVTPAKGTLGSSVNFNSSVLGTSPMEYLWNFKNMGDPTVSGDATPVVNLTRAGNYLCNVKISNDFGDATTWFNFYVGKAPHIARVLWTSTIGGHLCWYFADVTGDFPMTWTWTFFDIFAPSPPYVMEGIPVVLLLPSYTGVFNCQLEAVNDFGSDVFEFEYEVTEVPPPPM